MEKRSLKTGYEERTRTLLLQGPYIGKNTGIVEKSKERILTRKLYQKWNVESGRAQKVGTSGRHTIYELLHVGEQAGKLLPDGGGITSG